MNKLIHLSIITLIISLSSCSKCDPSNSTEGIIVEDAIVRIIGQAPEDLFITNATSYDKNIEMSLDGGVSYKSVDFNKYSVLGLSTSATCSSGYNRNVTVNKIESTVNYTISITECSTCKSNTTIPNYVLTTAVPEEYTPVYEIIRN
ncbi:hypothetical protein [Brumimicrobium mesophilum]|uniref:hypothetical protein n=1 Tax=Brumimicrobium mesophilum TaxID=392717 RepID=UPI000D140EEE|nr:hypothetical protein [Brumimicrobium mesophilum]